MLQLDLVVKRSSPRVFGVITWRLDVNRFILTLIERGAVDGQTKLCKMEQFRLSDVGVPQKAKSYYLL